MLYQDQWLNASPLKPALGSLTNYTLDSFFGGERLVRPYTIYKATENDTKLIDIEEEDAKKISGHSVQDLLKAGTLFAVDRQYQESYQKLSLTICRPVSSGSKNLRAVPVQR